MADPIITPQMGLPIIEDGAATQEMHNWMAIITDAVNDGPPLTGTGTPEAVVVASVGRWFVDTAANDVYFKETGDGDTGWILTT